MILYHASTALFDKFYIPYGGLHLGGLHSALEAALRHLRSPRNDSGACTVYLYQVHVQLGTVHCTEDLGGEDSWREVFSTEYDSVQYDNKYELDNVPSYMVWDSSRVQIHSVQEMHMDEAEDILVQFEESVTWSI